jgi:hypothetical protein
MTELLAGQTYGRHYRVITITDDSVTGERTVEFECKGQYEGAQPVRCYLPEHVFRHLIAAAGHED